MTAVQYHSGGHLHLGYRFTLLSGDWYDCCPVSFWWSPCILGIGLHSSPETGIIDLYHLGSLCILGIGLHSSPETGIIDLYHLGSLCILGIGLHSSPETGITAVLHQSGGHFASWL